MTYTQQRPTNRELDNKIKAAKKAISKKKVYIANLTKMYSDLNELDLGNTEEIWRIVNILLEEISYDDYCGGHPPEQAREQTIEGCDLYAFSWQSTKYNRKMYLKFSIMEDFFYLVSIHESRR